MMDIRHPASSVAGLITLTLVFGWAGAAERGSLMKDDVATQQRYFQTRACSYQAAANDLSETYMASSFLSAIMPDSINGLYIPTNQALQNFMDDVLKAAGAQSNGTTTGAASGANLTALMQTPEFQDILKLHIVPFNGDEAALDKYVAGQLAKLKTDVENLVRKNINNSYVEDRQELGKWTSNSLLGGASRNFCPNGPTTTTGAVLEVVYGIDIAALRAGQDANKSYSLNMTGRVQSAGSTGRLLYLSSFGTAVSEENSNCSVSVGIIDAVLLPCALADSSVASMAAAILPASSTTPRGIINTNSTSPPPRKPKSSSNIGIIIGAVVGALAAVAVLIGLAYWWFVRSRKNQGHKSDPEAPPHTMPAVTPKQQPAIGTPVRDPNMIAELKKDGFVVPV